MRKEIIIRMYVTSEKCQTKAMKVAATVSGVESVSLAGGDKSLLLVIGDGVDSNKLSKKLKKKVGATEIVELRTVDTFEAVVAASPYHAGAKGAMSPYNNHWQYQQYSPSPYTYHHHPSPMDYSRGGGGYGDSSYSRVVARSHPANYSPLVERHDYQPMDHRSSSVGSRGAGAGAGTTSYKSVPRRDSGSGSGSGSCCIM